LKYDHSYVFYGEILFEELKVIKEVLILIVESRSSFMIWSTLKKDYGLLGIAYF
jgi:hypothetical protein